MSTETAATTAGAVDEDWDPNADERRNVTRLLRWVGLFIAWPALTLGFIEALEWRDHILHIAGLVPLGFLGIALAWQAPRIAKRFYPPE